MNVLKYFDGFSNRDWQTSAHDEHVNFAVVGIGDFASRRALPALRDADFCEPTVLVTGSRGESKQIAAEFGIDRVISYVDYHNGVAVDEYDVAYVATPNSHHLEYITTAAELGKDVLCEKPLEATVDRAERAINTCSSAGVELMVAYRLQTDPAVRRIREMIRDGSIGKPVHITGQFCIHILGGSRTIDNWRFDPGRSGGGALMDVGIYPINTSRFFLDTDPIAVQATTSAPDAEFEDVDEHATFQLEFPGDCTGSYMVSYDAQEVDRLQIIGSDGQITLESAFFSQAARRVVIQRGLNNRFEYAGPGINEIREEFDYLAERLLSGHEIEPDGRDGLVDLQVIRAAYESANEGNRVEIR